MGKMCRVCRTITPDGYVGKYSKCKYCDAARKRTMSDYYSGFF